MNFLCVVCAYRAYDTHLGARTRALRSGGQRGNRLGDLGLLSVSAMPELFSGCETLCVLCTSQRELLEHCARMIWICGDHSQRHAQLSRGQREREDSEQT